MTPIAKLAAPSFRRRRDGDRGTITISELGTFQLAGLLAEGMSFPLDFGFIPSAKAEDGDPLDVLVLTDQPTAMGAVLDVRLVGVIEAEQTEEESPLRNGNSVMIGLHRLIKGPEVTASLI